MRLKCWWFLWWRPVWVHGLGGRVPHAFHSCQYARELSPLNLGDALKSQLRGQPASANHAKCMPFSWHHVSYLPSSPHPASYKFLQALQDENQGHVQGATGVFGAHLEGSLITEGSRLHWATARLFLPQSTKHTQPCSHGLARLLTESLTSFISYRFIAAIKIYHSGRHTSFHPGAYKCQGISTQIEWKHHNVDLHSHLRNMSFMGPNSFYRYFVLLYIFMNCAPANLGSGGLDDFVHGCVTIHLKEAFANNCEYLQVCRRTASLFALFLPERYKRWKQEEARFSVDVFRESFNKGMIDCA